MNNYVKRDQNVKNTLNMWKTRSKRNGAIIKILGRDENTM